VRGWLKNWDWTAIVETNQKLCEKGRCFHKISTAGGAKAQALWEENREKPMTLQEMVLFCKRIHFREPFVNMNGNTLAAVALEASEHHIPKTCSKYELEEAICTVVAGTVQGREEIILKTESEAIDPPKLSGPEMK
jgi:hypothetical protein